MAYNQQYGQRPPQGAPPGQRPPQGYPPQPQGGRGGGYPPGPAPNQYNNGQPPQQQYGQQPPAQVRVCSFCLFEGSNDILLIFPFSLSLSTEASKGNIQHPLDNMVVTVVSSRLPDNTPEASKGNTRLLPDNTPPILREAFSRLDRAEDRGRISTSNGTLIITATWRRMRKKRLLLGLQPSTLTVAEQSQRAKLPCVLLQANRWVGIPLPNWSEYLTRIFRAPSTCLNIRACTNFSR